MHRAIAVIVAFATEAARAADVPLRQLATADVYGVSVSIGTPAQNFTLLLSIDQPMLWVPSKHCRNCNFLKVAPYDHNASTSFAEDGRNFTDAVTCVIDNIDSVQGFWSTDDVSVMGSDAMTAAQLSIGETTEARFIDFTQGWDGVLGLGRDGDASGNLVLALAAEKRIPRPVVGLWLDGQIGRPGAGELSLGRADEAKFVASTLRRYPVMPPPASATHPRLMGLWRVPLEKGISVNGGSFDTVSKTVGVVLNTANPYIFLPDQELSTFAKRVGAIDYSNLLLVYWNATLNLTFHFSEDQQVTLTEKELLMNSSSFGEAYAMLPLAPLSQASGLPQECGWVLGTAFLSKVYTVLDFGDSEQGPSVSLAHRAEKASAGSTGASEGMLKMPLVSDVQRARGRRPQDGVTTPMFV